MFSPLLNYIKLWIGLGESYNMSYAKLDECLHECACVKDIYYRENIPIDYSNARIGGAIAIATEYLTLNCIDCSKTWNGKRMIYENVEIKVGKSSTGARDRIPSQFIEIKSSECDHMKFSVDENTIEYIEQQNYYNECFENDESQTQSWAFCQAECKYCKCKLYVKSTVAQSLEEFTDNSKWEKCKIMLK